MPNEIANIKPDLTDDKLDDELHAIKRKFEKSIRIEQNKLLEKMKNDMMSSSDYDTVFKEQIRKISDLNSAALAEYVAHRRAIIDLFEHGLFAKEDGKFNKEKYMHELIYPMRTSSEAIEYFRFNDSLNSYMEILSYNKILNDAKKRNRILFQKLGI